MYQPMIIIIIIIITMLEMEVFGKRIWSVVNGKWIGNGFIQQFYPKRLQSHSQTVWSFKRISQRI